MLIKLKRIFAISVILVLSLTTSILGGGFVNALDIGFSNNQSFDNTPAWNAMIANGGPGEVYFEGAFTFKTQPNAITRVLTISGIGVNGTALIRDFVPANQLDSFIKSTATLTVEHMGIIARQGTTGEAIRLEGLGASSSVISNVYITAETGSSWAIPLTLWSANSLGIRGVYLENVELFAATVHGFWFVNVQGLTAGVQYYPAGGTVSHAVIQNNGANRSASINFVTRHLVQLYVYSTDNMTVLSVNGTIMVTSSDSTNIKIL